MFMIFCGYYYCDHHHEGPPLTKESLYPKPRFFSNLKLILFISFWSKDWLQSAVAVEKWHHPQIDRFPKSPFHSDIYPIEQNFPPKVKLALQHKESKSAIAQPKQKAVQNLTWQRQRTHLMEEEKKLLLVLSVVTMRKHHLYNTRALEASSMWSGREVSISDSQTFHIF